MDLIKLAYQTICVKEYVPTESGQSHILPIHASSSFSYNNIEDSIDVFTGQKEGFVYSRYGNPTISFVEEKIAALECVGTDIKGACLLTSSGLSAISTLCMSILKPGDVILTQYNLYGGTTEIFKKILGKNGIEIQFIDLEDQEAVELALKTNSKIKLCYFESPSNPTLNCLNIQLIVNACKTYDVKTAIDNTFSTSYLQKPFLLGVDFVIYSTTKYLNGHGNSIAGAIVCRSKSIRHEIWNTLKLLGTNTNAFDAWLIHNGIKTLPLRMDKHCNNAMVIAQFLEDHPKVKKVNYPGLKNNKYHKVASQQMSAFGAMLSFEIDGDISLAKKFMNSTEICTIAATLGNVDTLLLHPASSSHLNIEKDIREANGITDGLIRVSVGIEYEKDLIDDINKALQNI